MKLTLSLACAALTVYHHPVIASPGDLDLGFNPIVNGTIISVALQSDGMILIAGRFSEVNGISRNGLARLHATGVLDQGFHPSSITSDFEIHSIALQIDGRILLGGSLTEAGAATLTGLTRLNADGSLDHGFSPVVDGSPRQSVERIVLQPDGKILLAGNFTKVNGVARNSMARLNPDGTLDLDFYPLAELSNEHNVYDLALQPDGKILAIRVGRVGPTFHEDFVRLNANGTVDTRFHVDTNDEVEGLALQADGKILIAGDFTTVRGVPRSGLARLHADGTLDFDFTPGAYGSSYVIQSRLDGAILIGGDLIGSGLQQLNTSGTLDTNFTSNVNNSVHQIAIQGDGKILIAGQFTLVNGMPRSHIARLIGHPGSEVSLGLLSVFKGLPGFELSSVTARTVVVEASTNLVDWIGIQSLPLARDPVRFDDPHSTNFPSRFYRVSWQP